jgi:hypothetical protein
MYGKKKQDVEQALRRLQIKMNDWRRRGVCGLKPLTLQEIHDCSIDRNRKE